MSSMQSSCFIVVHFFWKAENCIFFGYRLLTSLIFTQINYSLKSYHLFPLLGTPFWHIILQINCCYSLIDEFACLMVHQIGHWYLQFGEKLVKILVLIIWLHKMTF